jgi:hypothetical protein
MSRSILHSPATGVTTCRSEKEDKRLANRRLRRTVVQRLSSAGDLDLLALPLLREVSDRWGMGKDGRQHHWGGCLYLQSPRARECWWCGPSWWRAWGK